MIVRRKVTIPGLLEHLSRRRLAVPASPLAVAAGPTDWGRVTSLPPSPSVGDTCRCLADKTNGIVWSLEYDGEGSFPWKVMGAPPPLWSEITTTEGTASTSYTNLATVGPSITVPLKGDYDVDIGHRLFSGPAGADILMSYAIGATAAVDADAANDFGAGQNANFFRPRRKTNLAAGAALVAKYRVSAASEAKWSARWMRVTPVRVG